MSLIRMLRTSQMTMSHTFSVDGTATAPTGTLQAVVTRTADGTAVSGSPFTYTMSGTTCAFALPAQAALDLLTVDWAGAVAGAVVTARDYVEVCGGFLFDLNTAKTRHNLGAYSFAQLADGRTDAEQECERICRLAFVPRFAHESHTGSGMATLGVGWPAIRAIRSVKVSGVAWSAGDVAALQYLDHGVIVRPAGAVWPAGAPVAVEYEHGLDVPPGEVGDAAMLRMASRLGRSKSGIPDRAQSYAVADGGVYRLSMPSAEATGIPDVDATYQRWSRGGKKRRAVFA